MTYQTKKTTSKRKTTHINMSRGLGRRRTIRKEDEDIEGTK